jgi:hypothetical protein
MSRRRLNNSVIPTGAKQSERSGGTCFFAGPLQMQSFKVH